MNLITEANKYIDFDLIKKQEIIDYYNNNCYNLVKRERKYRIKFSDNWCACFTSVIAHKCGYNSESFPYEVSVGEQVKIAKNRNMFFQNMELCSVGDLIIFDWKKSGWPNHVGFIKEITGGIIKTIEGNKNNRVGERNISIKSDFILGFIKL